MRTPKLFLLPSPSFLVLGSVFGFSTILFLMVDLFRSELYIQFTTPTYLVIHNITEFFSIIVSFSIFGIGWFSYNQSRDRHALFLSVTFFTLGILNFMHALSFSEMPDFITPNSTNKSILFWISARAFSSVAFFISAFIYPETTKRWLTKQILLPAALFIAALNFVGIIFYPTHLPAMFIEGNGLTLFKIYLEYLITGMFLASFIAYWIRFLKTGDKILLLYLASFIGCIFSQLSFTLYRSAFDTYNMLGHIYKVIAFYLIYRGIFTSSIQYPYIKLSDVTEKLRMEIAEHKQTIEKLLDTNKYIQELIDSANVIIVGIDGSCHTKIFNNAAEKITGYSREDLAGLDLFEKIIPRDRYAYVWEVFQNYRQNKGEMPRTLETPILTKSGEERFISWQNSTISFPDKAISSISFGIDITEHKHAEQALRESEEKYRNIFEESFDGLVITSPGGKILNMNKKGIEMFGYDTKEEILRLDLERDVYVYPLDRKRILAIVNAQGTAEYEVLVKKKSGGKILTYCSLTAVKDETGSITSYRGIMRDITEKKQAEEALRESEYKMRSIVDNIGIGITLISSKMEVLEMNQRMHKWFPNVDLSQRPLCYRTFNEPPRDCACEFCPTVKTLQDGLVHEGKAQTMQSGVIRNFRIISSPIVNMQGNVTAAIEMVEDITEKLLLESQLRQSQKMEAIGRLAGGVAHDFNNMLSVIVGSAELGIDKLDASQPVYSDLHEILKASQRSAALTRQLLAFARKQTIAPRVLNLNETVEGMLKMLRRLIGEDIDLAWMPKVGVWQVKVDPSQIDQILANLCVNARDAIEGVGKVTIETGNAFFDKDYCAKHAESLPGEYVLLAVSDNGCGMNKETLDKLFEPFFTTKEMGKGTGLGLATVYGVVKQNNGFINVYSEPGHGTTFKIYLPRHEAKGEQMVQEKIKSPLLMGQETILLVEDEQATRAMAKRMLEKFGYRVIDASTPSEAIRIANEHGGNIDMLITDVVMPEMNGNDLSAKITSLCPKIRCLFMSGYTNNVIVHNGTLDEGIHFIQKPFSMQTLASKVREVLDNKKEELSDE